MSRSEHIERLQIVVWGFYRWKLVSRARGVRSRGW